MNKWIAEFELEDGDTMPEHMDLNYMGAKIDFHCRPKPYEAEKEAKDGQSKKDTDKRKQLIEELSKMPAMVAETAYLYAVNYARYGEDVTKQWTTAIQNVRALEKAYREGYSDALRRLTESE